jgi:outer membrane lipoprotein-sorting protein
MRSVLVLTSLIALAAPAAAETPSVDDLLAKNVASRGGAEKLRAINTRKVTGHVTAQGIDMSMSVISKRPNLMLQEMRMGDRRLVTAFDGQHAWGINPMLGDSPQPLHGAQETLLRDQAYFDGPLALARSRGDKIEVLGQEDVGGTPTWKLAITHEGRATTIYLDTQTGLERKVASTVSDGGMDLQIESLISDYQPTEGILVPRKVSTLVGGQQQATVSIDTVEFNLPVDDGIFKMPEPPSDQQH